MAKAKEGATKKKAAAKGAKGKPKAATKAPSKKAATKKATTAKKPAPKKAPAKAKAAKAKPAKKEAAAKKAAKPKAETKKPAKKAVKKPAKKRAAPKAPKKAPKKEAPKKKAPPKEPPKKEPAKKAKKEPAEKGPAKKPPKKKPARKEEVPKVEPEGLLEPKPEVPPGTEDGLLLFNRWDITEVQVSDPGLRRYMNLTPTYLPHTGGRWANRPFAKARVNLVERFINNMMRTEKYTGKKNKTIKVVQNAFALVEKRAKRNPVQVLVDGLENAAPREEVTRLRFGGISVPRAVDIAPARRLDLALRNITVGAVRATFKSPRSASECLASEMLMAAEGDINSYAIGKKEEMERIAGSAR